MNYASKLAFEAFVVGVVLAGVHFAFIKAVPLRYREKLPEYLWMFGLGVIIHLGFEVLGLNKLYCINGAACNRISIMQAIGLQ